jgi:hypothetical protein
VQRWEFGVESLVWYLGVEEVLQRREGLAPEAVLAFFFFFFFTLVTGPRRSLSLKLSETRVFEP